MILYAAEVRRVLASLLLLPLLSGCVAPPPPAPMRSLAPEELLPHYVAGPDLPLPDHTAFTLGTSYQPGGTVVGWRASRAVPVFRFIEGRPVEVAQLQPDGAITGAPLLQPGPAVSLQADLSGYGSNVGGRGAVCPVDGLKATAQVQVQLPVPDTEGFALRVEDSRLGVQPLYSPIITHIALRWDVGAYETPNSTTAYHLVYVAEDVTVQGEQRCIGGYEQDGRISIDQDNVRVNLTLSRGWNALLRNATWTYVGDTFVNEITWTTLPREIVERWR